MKFSQNNYNNHHDVFISSTTKDLIQHRKAAMEAVWRCDMYPRTMERDTATDGDAVIYSMSMVNQSHVYIGIFAHRYGHILPNQEISITEMEYRRAVERNIPILIFLMDEEHPLEVNYKTVNDLFEFENDKRQRIEELKQELLKKHVVGFFSSTEDLGKQVYQALDQLKSKKVLSTMEIASVHSPSVSLIPKPPEPYIAHKYVQTRDFFGRDAEITAINEWAKNDNPIMILEAIGGVGKSALKWFWLNNHAKNVMPNLAGIIWWSFYESDATVTNLVHHALSYITNGASLIKAKTQRC